MGEKKISISDCPVSPEMLAGILRRVADNTISNNTAERIFDEMWKTGKSADQVIEECGLRQVTDTSVVNGVIDRVISTNLGKFAELKGGKDKLINFFIGQVMKLSKGKVSPTIAKELLQKKVLEKV